MVLVNKQEACLVFIRIHCFHYFLLFLCAESAWGPCSPWWLFSWSAQHQLPQLRRADFWSLWVATNRSENVSKLFGIWFWWILTIILTQDSANLQPQQQADTGQLILCPCLNCLINLSVSTFIVQHSQGEFVWVGCDISYFVFCAHFPIFWKYFSVLKHFHLRELWQM